MYEDELWAVWLRTKGWDPEATEMAARNVAQMAVDDIEVLQKRLETTRVWVYQKGEEREKEIPFEERHEQIDGIECRDETIKLQDRRIGQLIETIKKQTQQIQRLRGVK